VNVAVVVAIPDSTDTVSRTHQGAQTVQQIGQKETFEMAKCEVCGNDYHLSFEVIASGSRHTFDSFECAIHKLAPVARSSATAWSPTARFIVALIARGRPELPK
jgi:hypothetical protein